MYSSVKMATEAVLSASIAVTTVPDGWTDDKGNALVNIALVTEWGIAFWEDQITPKGEKHSVPFYESMCAKSLARPNNKSLISDNPTTMTSLKNYIAKKYCGPGWKTGLACNFHVVDLTVGDLLGLTGAHTAEYAIAELADPKHGDVQFCKSVFNLFRNHHVPHDLFDKAREEQNIIIDAGNRGKEKEETEPRCPSLKLAGATRKTSNATMLVSVGMNKDTLQKVVNSVPMAQHIQDLPKGKAPAVGAREAAETVRNAINKEGKLEGILLRGEFLSLFQQAQRVMEKPGMNLLDVAYNYAELVRRVRAFPVSDDLKTKAVGSIKQRFIQFNYTGAFACAVVCDPRLQYNAVANVGEGKLLDLSWANKTAGDLVTDARLWIEHNYQFDAKKDILLEQFGDLLEGSIFSMQEPEAATRLMRAVDMPPWKWCKLYGRTCRVSELFNCIILPLMCMVASADGVEHGNSTYKWVQAGRVTLGCEAARKLVYIILNIRALKQHNARATQVFEPGAFKLGWGWAPASHTARVVAENAEVEAEPDNAVQAQVARVASAVAALSAEPAPSLTAAPLQLRRSPRGSEKRARTATAADGGSARSMMSAQSPPQSDEPAVGDMVACWRPNCGNVFEYGKGSLQDKLACGRCQHFAALPGAAVTDGTEAA